MAASILSTFNIGKAVDEDGLAIEPHVKYKSGLIWWVLSQFQAVEVVLIHGPTCF